MRMASGSSRPDRHKNSRALSNCAESLADEHKELMGGLSALVDAAEGAELAHAALPDGFAPRLSAFLESLRQHEHAENELVQALVQQDVGVGD